MLDVKNPEIDVDAIMQRIQEKIRLRKEAPASAPSAPPPALMQAPDSSVVTQKIAQARDSAQVGLALPPMSRTHGVARLFAQPLAKAFLRVAQLVTRDQRQFNAAAVDALQTLFNDQGARQTAQAARDAQAAQDLDRARREADAGRHELAAKIDALAAKAAALEAQLARQAAEQSRRGDEIDTRQRNANDATAADRSKQTLSVQQLRAAVSLQERRLSMLLEEARRRLPQPLDEAQLKNLADELPHVQDAKYLAFEDTFRGSREDIKGRVSIYVERFRAAGAGADKAPILDVGCGRGELIEVLRDAGLKASGVDGNRAAVEQSRERGLDVVQGDLFDHLRALPDGSLGGLAGLHVVEHLPFELLLKLLDETVRVLRPGGLCVFETPNPQNILVGASNFYLDPTHRNPVHPQTLHYLVESRGLVRVETTLLHPFPKEILLPEADSPASRFINEHFFGPQDYAVLGQRP
jgi:SAM-dependent methyltransferase